MGGLSQASEITLFWIWLSGYLTIYLLLLCLSPRFRGDFLQWMTFRDPLGLRFWSRNFWFLIFTLAYFLIPAVLFASEQASG
ncbi:hypothetical protein RSK20926_04132 [Roseobacter sp. SK209-2-6]|nr:hypothetical protein RSK20926_04132 [Roseobacter sp. SK209-2-6]